jgi:hypothetical protein
VGTPTTDLHSVMQQQNWQEVLAQALRHGATSMGIQRVTLADAPQFDHSLAHAFIQPIMSAIRN